MITKVVGLYFSPSGETAKITKRIVGDIAARLNDYCIDEISSEFYDIFSEPPKSDLTLGDDNIVVIGMPSSNGRIPERCASILRRIHGSGTLSVTLVAYGNSTYGDSLYELHSLAERQGFKVISAAAFVAEHPMFGRIASSRPDARDLRKMDEFSDVCFNKMKRFCGTEIEEMKARVAPLNIKGKMPSRPPARVLIHPSANRLCVCCGRCAEVCPVHAIDRNDPKKVDLKKCISCTACVHVCEHGARGFRGPACAASRLALEAVYRKRKDPEWFI